MDDQTITQAYRKNLVSYGGIFLLTAFLEMLLAFFLSRSLTRSIQILCEKVDAKNLDDTAVTATANGRISWWIPGFPTGSCRNWWTVSII